MSESDKRASLPEVELETCIILPFQISASYPGGQLDASALRSYLERSRNWEKAGEIDEPDPIACAGLDEAQLQRIRYQAYNYFHPFVRRFWYDSKQVQRFRHRSLRALRAQLRQPGEFIEFAAAADLYHFLPDIGVLVMHLQAVKPLPLQQAQQCLDRLRRIYPPYIERGRDECGKEVFRGGHFPACVELLDADGALISAFQNEQLDELLERVGQHRSNQSRVDDLQPHCHILARHWADLLNPLGDDGPYRIMQLGDDRSALASKITLVNDGGNVLVERIDRGNLIRLCFADDKGSDPLPYAQHYLQEFETRFCYDRFWYLSDESSDSPSRIMNCGYAFTWLGGQDAGYFTNEADGAPPIFRHIYVPMAIIAHFQKAALLVASRRLADLSSFSRSGEPAPPKPKDFKQLEANFIAFTQVYWFDEITPQEQGIELFDMWRRALRLPELYQEHRQELQDIVAYINGREEDKQTQAAHQLNQYALVFALISVALAFLGLLTGVMGMNLLPEEMPGAVAANARLHEIMVEAFGWLARLMSLEHVALITIVLIIIVPIFSRTRER